MTIRHRQLIESTRRLGLNLDAIVASVECMESEESVPCNFILSNLEKAKDLINKTNELLARQIK